MWFELKGDSRLGECASQGCGGQPAYRLEADGIGSNYCSGCRARICPPRFQGPIERWRVCPSTHCERSEECRSPHECSGTGKNLTPEQRALLMTEDDFKMRYRFTHHALVSLYRLCKTQGNFKNGVEHNGIDEGEVHASGVFDHVEAVLRGDFVK